MADVRPRPKPELKPDPNQLVIFAKVVETGSFTAAGRELGLPKSTVSRKIALLEERLGVQLLFRTTRKLAMTEVGAAFYERCARISTQIDEVERALEDLRGEPTGLLRVAVPRELALVVSADLIVELLLTHARLDVELELTGRGGDAIERDGFDLALTLEPSAPAAGMLAVELGSVVRRLVASPEYLERRGFPTTLAQLERHDLCVSVAGRATPLLLNGGVRPSFELVGPNRASVRISARPRLLVNDDAALREAALAGVGIALLPVLACRRELEDGRLCVVLEDWASADMCVYALYPIARHFAAKLAVFLELMRERLEPRIAELAAHASPSCQAEAPHSA
jgi:DNA-binding transcriptional LysR family regulator